jgi:beta-galactosidase
MPSPLLNVIAASDAVQLIGPRSNLVTENLSIALPLGPNLPGLDIAVTRVESLPPGTRRTVENSGAVLHWAETLQGTAKTLLRFQDGAPVLVGANGLHYLGGWPDQALWDRIIQMLAQQAGLPLTPLPEGLRLRDTGTHRFAFNYAPDPVLWEGQEIAAAGVAWWPRQASGDAVLGISTSRS